MNNKPQAYGTVIDSGTIRFERLLSGPIERVWAYLTESEKRQKWLAAGEMGTCIGEPFDLRFEHANLSTQPAPRPERFKTYECGDAGHHHITRFEPMRFLSFTWNEGEGAESEVSFELTPQGNKVLLSLTHRRLADRTTMVGFAGGWHTHLDILAERLNDQEPSAFWPRFAKNESYYEEQICNDLVGPDLSSNQRKKA